MEFSLDMTVWGAVIIIIGSLVIGVVSQFIGDVRSPYQWIVVTIAAIVGAVFASEMVTSWQTIEPVWEGVALLPALAGGIVLGVIADAIVRFATGGSYRHATT
jgi:uncharacterized membrane protein YeaQ/YmgE (transglycosylase-associated protein family)